MITIKDGDLLQATEDIIAHQVNCHGVAGGLAYAIFQDFPYAEEAYRKAVEDANRHGEQMGLLGCMMICHAAPEFRRVANMFGQYFPGADYRPDILRQCLHLLAHYAKANDLSVALPYKLSCGICGGNWDQVYRMIEETMEGVQVTIYRKN